MNYINFPFVFPSISIKFDDEMNEFIIIIFILNFIYVDLRGNRRFAAVFYSCTKSYRYNFRG
jgi:hypothetical protein